MGAVAVPTIQFSKEYSSQAAKATYEAEILALVRDCRTKILERLLNEKDKELKVLLAKVSLDTRLADIAGIIDDIRPRITSDVGEDIVLTMPIKRHNPDNPRQPIYSVPVVSGVPEPDSGELMFLMAHGQAMLRRTATIAQNAHDARAASKKKAASKVVQATEDVVMAGTEDTNASIKTLIESSLSNFAQKYKLGTTSKGKKSELLLSKSSSSCSNVQPRGTQTSRETKVYSEGSHKAAEEEGTRWKGQGGTICNEKEGREKVNRILIEWKPCSVDGKFHVCEERRRWPSPPPVILCTAVRNDELFVALPQSIVKEWVTSHLPRELVEYTPSLDAGIFMQPGISLPCDVEFSIAHNGKFIFHQEPNPKLIYSAWLEFENSLRWKYHHGDEPDRKFLPRFHIKSKLYAPAQDLGFETGLIKGRQLSRRNVETLLPLKKVKILNPNLSRVREVLEEKRLLVLSTDKNLGIAVVEVPWYEEQVARQLADASTYKGTHHLMVLQYMRRAKNKIIKACEEAKEYHLEDMEDEEWELPILSKYLRNSVSGEYKVPEFKGLPKIHKSPWTLRPIIPSHSWVTSGASQVADYLLRPILDTMPWIVNSTIQVVNELQSIPVTRDEQVWLISGDVQSFYTNVPIEETIKCILDVADSLDYPVWKLLMLKHLLEAIMNNNCCRYKKEYYLQLMGIAMGTSCAPAFANLYAAQFEKDIPSWKATTGLRYYCRYIDDILIIFVGTAAQRDTFLRMVKLGSLAVTWEIRTAFEGLAFLDLELFFSMQSQTRGLHTRLFRKKLNRNMYIPWSSAHPDSVKKSFIKGELTRLMYLSSQREYFEESKRSFYINLRKRGYPAEILSQWFTQVSYNERALVLQSSGVKSQRRDIPLIMPSEYNPVWNYVNLHEVYAEIRAQWQRSGVELPDSLKGPLILSLRRTRNFTDASTVWNKGLLNPEQRRIRAAVSRAANKEAKRSHFTAFSSLVENENRKPSRRKLSSGAVAQQYGRQPQARPQRRRSRTPDPFLALLNRDL